MSTLPVPVADAMPGERPDLDDDARCSISFG